MLSFSTGNIIAGVTLLAVCNALPAGTQNFDCPPSKPFYSCALNNFSGCCSVDPCALKSGCPDAIVSPRQGVVTSSTTTVQISTPTSSTSSQTSSAPAVKTCVPGTKAFRQFNPTLQNIGSNTESSSLFHIKNYTNPAAVLSQVFTFRGVPATASNIGLGWFISNTVPRFETDNSATGVVHLLDSTKIDLTASSLTASAVTAAIDSSAAPIGGRVGSGGFGFWPELARPNDHSISNGNLPNRETLSMRIEMLDLGEVLIQQTAQDGLYLVYDC